MRGADVTEMMEMSITLLSAKTLEDDLLRYSPGLPPKDISFFMPSPLQQRKCSESSDLLPSKGENMSDEKLEKLMGFNPGELEETADAYEKDEWPAGHTVRIGRPPISEEPSTVMSSRVSESVAEAFDKKALAHGQTRTERLRELINIDVLTT